MKTTIDIADGLLAEAKARATAESTTLRQLVERGLRVVLAEKPAGDTPLNFPTARVQPLPGVDPYDDWGAIRDEIYDTSDEF